MGVRIERRADGIRLRVRAQPRASRTQLAGEYDGALRVRLAAPPVEGAANEELRAFLAGRFGVPKSAVRIVAGETGRDKTVDVAGIDLHAAARALRG